ncbi:MAG: DNA polymerase III subunit alpha [Lachnospiraceae bacterium]|jgi:DNA polymerase-3 subunit alpha|nr:DNA polymerase III subunit alpha [Lachnospiraceae bacterium]
MGFAHLHVHTEYSLLDGSSKIKELVGQAKKLGMKSLAITDHGAMYGVIDFYKAAKEAGIRPILGCEVYVTRGSRFEKEGNHSEDRYYHLVLLAENNIGYSNLMKIVSKGFIDGFYYKPRVDYEVLRTYHEGIIALSACLAGEIPKYLIRGMYEEACQTARGYEEIFGRGNFFLELQDHGIPEQRLVDTQLVRMSKELEIPLVATNDIHYTFAEDVEPHDILLCIQTNKKVGDENRMRYEGGQYYCKSEEEMRKLFPYAEEAIDNTEKIADRCQVEIEFGVTKLPQFDVPEGKNAWEYLNELCLAGLNERYPSDDGTLKERLDYELDVIRTMGYVDYFLIVWDFIKYARDHEIMVGPGRGSAAGSIVAYTLGITNIDPIRYNLLFERFLNPERISMPDIDVDFCFERRQEVIDYVGEKYGKDRVVQIVTFGTMAARGVIRDVGRALDLPYALCDQIAKMVPRELGITLDDALKTPDLAAAYRTDEQVKYLIDMSKRLEGLPRHASMHAAGVVISQKPVEEYVPLSRAADGSVTTQFTMTTLEELGLLKMDFLGLRTLTVIQNAVDLIEKSKGISLDIDHIDFDDKAVYDSLCTGRCDGVFQLESSGMKSFMKELMPHSLEDVIAGISLYRPGPMDFIPQYIRGKSRPEEITYHCPQLEPILEPTYGCIVYQEQVMQIVRDLGGYTMGRSDLVRRAMSKKKASVMEKERQNFVYGNEAEGVKGCISNGIPEETAQQIFDEMTDFARYAFNKSHAAAYAVVAYETAYLKYHYPVEYMAALMTSVIDNSAKVSEYILVSRSMGIPLLPPDINEGMADFSVSQGGIRYGLSAIKSIGRNVIEEIVKKREESGPYTSLKDFIYRLTNKEVNKRSLENFIKSGAMDNLPGTRKQKMLASMELLEQKNREKKLDIAGQMSLFDFMGEEEKKAHEVRFQDVGEYEKEELLAYEKEVLGIYVSGHPLEKYEEKWRQNITAVTSDFNVDDENGEANVTDGRSVTVGGMITAKTVKTTKQNQLMAFLTVEDMVGTVEVLVFPRDYEANRALLVEDNKIFVTGRVSLGDEAKGKLICEKIVPFDGLPKTLWLQFADKASYFAGEEELMKLIADSDGNDQVGIFLQKERAKKFLGISCSVRADEELLEKLALKYGAENVKVVEKPIENRGRIQYN